MLQNAQLSNKWKKHQTVLDKNTLPTMKFKMQMPKKKA